VESGRLWLGLRTDRDRLRVRFHHLASGFARRAPHTAPLRLLLGAVPGGLVLGDERSTFVWDARTGRRSRTTPGAFVLATHGSQIMSCGGRCRSLLIADGQRGRVLHAPRGARFIASNASFSTGGALAAVPVGSHERARVAIIDVASATSRLVPHLRLGGSVPFAWAPAGETLYAALPGGRIVAYDAGSDAPRPVGLRFSDPILQLLVAG
jgi:hypothetical protein